VSTGVRPTDSGPDVPPEPQVPQVPVGPDLPPELALHRPGSGRRRRLWRRLRVPVAILAVLAILAGATWLVAFSPVLATRSVSVEGTVTLTPAQVLAAAKVPLGVPLARLDTTAIADRVAALAPVRSVSVTRHLPNSVEVRVTERTAAALIVGDTGIVQLVDTTGDLFPPPGAVPTDLPVVVDSGVALDVAAVQSAVTVLDALPPAISAEVTAVVVTDDDAVLLDLAITGATSGATGSRRTPAEQTVVKWGTAAQTPLKTRVLAALLKVTHDPWLDVSAPDEPVSRSTIPHDTLPAIPAVGRAAG
jgi:cell division protein FtsQ